MGCKDPGKKAECKKTCKMPNKCQTVKKECVCLPNNKFLKKYKILYTNNSNPDALYERKYKLYTDLKWWGFGQVYDYTKADHGKENYYALDTKQLHLWVWKNNITCYFYSSKRYFACTNSGSIYLVVPTQVGTIPKKGD